MTLAATFTDGLWTGAAFALVLACLCAFAATFGGGSDG